MRPRRRGITIREMLVEYRQRLREDAEGTLDDLGIESIDDGYRIGPGNAAQSPYLQRAGLQPGDVILSVNGRPVGNVQQDQLERIIMLRLRPLKCNAVPGALS